MAIRYKNNGRYMYETHNKWNKELKKYQTIWSYLGVVDPTTKSLIPKRTKNTDSEKLIVDYGNTFAMSEFCRLSGFTALISYVFRELANALLALVFYRLSENGGMNMAQEWYQGNYAQICFPNLDLASQRISELLCKIGEEQLWRRFFAEYTKAVYTNNGVIIDSTGLPNDINIPLTALGHHGGDIANEIRMIMVVDRLTGEPLYFRYVAGNIVDVSTLKTTMDELEQLHINANYALLDAGYCSKENITALYQANISFLTRVPAGRQIHKDAIEAALPTLETLENAIQYGDRVLFVECVELTIYDSYIGYAYVCLDVKRKADDITRIIKESILNKEDEAKTLSKMRTAGIFVLLSPDEVPTNEIINLYYLRQSAEQIFELSKSYADILPLRVHGEETLRGILMINFIAITLCKNMNAQLPDKIPFENALKFMRSQKCKVYENGKLLLCEPNKRQREIMDAINNTVGKFSGG